MVKRRPVKSKNQVPKSPKVKKDPIAEYQAAIRKKGVVEVLTLTDDDCLAKVRQHISTQSLGLDMLFNGKGIPTGRVTEIYGPPHIGKSTLIDHLFASVQSMGGVAILFDTETARDIEYTNRIGVDASKLQIVQFSKNEMHIENVMIKLMDTVEWWSANYPDTPVVIGWDSLGGTATKDEIEKRLGSGKSKSKNKDGSDKKAVEKPAAAAKILRTAARQFPTKLGNTKVAVVVANHEYVNFNVGGGKSKKETYGGEAVRHLATLRAKLFPLGWIKKGDSVVGRRVGISLEKNRLGVPFVKGEVGLISGIGIDNTWTLYETLKEAKIIVTSGSWGAINLDGEVINFQGWSGLSQKCKEDPKLFEKLVSVYNNLFMKGE